MNIKIKSLLCDAGVFSKEYIKPEEVGNHPSDKLIKDDTYNYVVEDFEMSDEEIKIALLARQTINIKTIKNIIVFNLVVSIILALLAIVPYIM